MRTAIVYAMAAGAEIAGCFAFWCWFRLDRSWWWALGGTGCLILFAWLLTLVETSAAGRAFASYGGIYIVATLLWMVSVEGLGLIDGTSQGQRCASSAQR
jgi:small multidrug resistance family-3 protein